MEKIKVNKKKQYLLRQKELIEKHGWKLAITDSKLLPDEDRAPLNGALRCFRLIYQRGPDGKKIKDAPKVRCKHPAAKGSFFCKKKHGGGNQNNLVHGHNSQAAALAQAAYQQTAGNLFEAFLKDPTAIEGRIEIANCQTVLNRYIEMANNPSKTVRNPKKAIKLITDILKNKLLSPLEKFAQIKQLCSQYSTITDGEVIDRILYGSETISRMQERIAKSRGRDEYMLTPDGLKMFVRALTEILKARAPDKLSVIQQDILDINIRTEGDLTKLPQLSQLKKVEDAKE